MCFKHDSLLLFNTRCLSEKDVALLFISYTISYSRASAQVCLVYASLPLLLSGRGVHSQQSEGRLQGIRNRNKMQKNPCKLEKLNPGHLAEM